MTHLSKILGITTTIIEIPCVNQCIERRNNNKIVENMDEIRVEEIQRKSQIRSGRRLLVKI